MGLHESRAKIATAVRDLLTLWSNTKVHWDDANSRHLEAEVLDPMVMDIRSAVNAMDQMGSLLSQIRRECE